MSRMQLKITLAGLAVALAAAVLAVSGMSKDWVYYMPVDDFLADASHQDARVRLHGVVSVEELEINSGALTASFELLGDTSQLHIVYNGVIPDQFQADREVVVEGQLDASGVFQADTLLTKCASKYEGGDSPHEDPRAAEDE